MVNEIVIVSLGAGDAEQITVKALKQLNKSDVILCPSTILKGDVFSRSSEILKSLGVDNQKIESYHLPMSHDRSAALEVYQKVALYVVELYKSGLNVAITAEGDGGFFSSSQYISDIVSKMGIEVRRIAGVPAFIECAALANIHIANGNSPLIISPKLESTEMVSRAINDGSNVVLMKLSQSQNAIKEMISACEEIARFHYIENCGSESEFYSNDLETIKNRKFPYFSILIVEHI